jgi:C4-dicarboxylate transporter
LGVSVGGVVGAVALQTVDAHNLGLIGAVLIIGAFSAAEIGAQLQPVRNVQRTAGQAEWHAALRASLREAVTNDVALADCCIRGLISTKRAHCN